MATRRMRIKAVANVSLAGRGRPDRPVTPISVDSSSMPASPIANLASPLASSSSVAVIPPLSPKSYGGSGYGNAGPFSPSYSRIPPKTPPPYHQPPSPSNEDIHGSNSNQFRPVPSLSPLPPSASLLQNIRSPSPIKLIHPPSPKRPDTPKTPHYGKPMSPRSPSGSDGDNNSRSAFSVLSPHPPPHPPPNTSFSVTQTVQRPTPTQSPNFDGGFLSPRPMIATSHKQIQQKSSSFNTFHSNSNSSDSNYCELFSPGKVEPSENSKHNFKNKFANSSGQNNNSSNTVALVSNSQQKNVNNSSETLKQRLQKPSSAFTKTKYQVARKDFMLKLNSQQEAPKRSEMTMLHFAFWNPPKPNGPRSRAVSICDEQDFHGGSNSNTENSIMSTGSIISRRATIGAVPITKQEKMDPVEEEPAKPLGPRVKVGPDGKLIIDEKSLVVETTESVRAKKQLAEMKTVSGSEFAIGSGFYRHKKLNKRGSDWTEKETIRFYRALSTCGTDFSMMTALFKNRTRAELKSKFKREDRRNKVQIDEALQCQEFDPMDGLSSDEEDILADERHPTLITKGKGKGKVKNFKGEENIAKLELSISKSQMLEKTSVKKEVMSAAKANINNNSNMTNPSTEIDIIANLKPKVEKTSADKRKQNLSDNVIPKDLDQGCARMPNVVPASIISDSTRINIQTTIENISKNVFAKHMAKKVAAKKDKANNEEPPVKKPRKKKAVPTVPAKRKTKSKSYPITFTDADVDMRPDILKFDPSDPLGFKVVVPSGGIVIDITNPDKVLQEHQLSENSNEVAARLGDDLSNDNIVTIVGPVIEQTKVPPIRKLPYRVPGPGGPPISNTKPPPLTHADEIEIEISCS